MPDYPSEWRRALEMVLASPDGCTASLLSAHGFRSEVIAGLVDLGLATMSIERVLAGGRTVEATRFKITDHGRVALEERRP